MRRDSILMELRARKVKVSREDLKNNKQHFENILWRVINDKSASSSDEGNGISKSASSSDEGRRRSKRLRNECNYQE